MAETSNVRAQSAVMQHVSKHWKMIYALMGGTGAMRECGKELLPQWPNEDNQVYTTRLQTAVLHPVFRRTVLVNAARPFSKAPVIESDLDDEWLENIDLQGSSMAQFANALLIDMLAYGLVGILADYPKADGVRTKADEKKAGVRPYLVKYAPQCILGWKVDDKFNLTLLRLLERIEEEDGEFGTTTVEQVRVLEPGKWRTFRKNDKEEWLQYEEGTSSLDFIPFVFCYGLKTAFGHGHSPLLDLAFQNVEHWQSSSDQQTILHVARVPILVAVGFGDAELTIGASKAVSTDNVGATLTYTEHSGKAIEAGRQSILDLEERMRATGAELISRKQAQTTATQITSEGEAQKSTLQQIVEAFEESLERALWMMGKWIGKETEAEVEFFKDYETMPDADATILAEAERDGVISKETRFEELKRRDILDPDREWKDEQERMKGQPSKPEKPDGVEDKKESKDDAG